MFQRREEGEAYVANPFMEAYTRTGQAKVKGVLEFAKVLLDNDQKFLLFTHHISVLDEYEKEMKKMKIPYMRIDGKTSDTKRDQNVKKFQNDESCMAALLSITAAYQGLTLTAASQVVFAEFYWTPGIMQQAEDRAHRISQDRCVNIYYMYGQKTIDELVYPLITQKSAVTAQSLDNQKSEYTMVNR